MYTGDFQVYPPSVMSDADWQPNRWWHQRLERYTGAKWHNYNYKPSAAGTDVCPDYGRLPGAFSDNGIGSYGYNVSAWGRSNSGLGGVLLNQFKPIILPEDIRLRTESEVVAPSDMMAIADATMNGKFADWDSGYFRGYADLQEAFPGGIYIELNMQPPYPLSPCEKNAALGIRRRHGGRWNVVFCDGHIESLKTQQLFYLRRDEIAKRWNYDNLPHREDAVYFY